MGKRRKSRPAGSKETAENDAQLWQVYSQRINPLNLKGRVPDTESDLFDAMMRQEAVSPVGRAAGKVSEGTPVRPRAEPKSGSGHDSGAATGSIRSGRSVAVSPPLAAIIDTKEVRRIGKGRKAIDARIDLHGMRQHEAHAALRVFLFRAVAKGHRLVLVITGKGTVARTDAASDAFGAFVNEGVPERGVLKRSVPMWLDEPDLRPIVVGYSTAHIRHGGEGAIYIQVRRSRP